VIVLENFFFINDKHCSSPLKHVNVSIEELNVIGESRRRNILDFDKHLNQIKSNNLIFQPKDLK